MTDRLAEIVRDFPRTYTITETDENGEEQTREEPRYGVTVIDLGGHPEEVIEVIGERAGRMRALAPTAANVGIRVYTFASQPKLDEVLAKVAEAGYAENWRGFAVSPEIGVQSWDRNNPVQLVIADDPWDESPWHHVLEDGCAWYWVDAEEGS